jgi:hypothetical protein
MAAAPSARSTVELGVRWHRDVGLRSIGAVSIPQGRRAIRCSIDASTPGTAETRSLAGVRPGQAVADRRGERSPSRGRCGPRHSLRWMGSTWRTWERIAPRRILIPARSFASSSRHVSHFPVLREPAPAALAALRIDRRASTREIPVVNPARLMCAPRVYGSSAGGAERHLEAESLRLLETIDHLEKIASLRIAAGTQHAHQALCRPFGPAA